MIEPFVRQAALEKLLEREKELSPEELHHSLHLGLTDPDFQINEITWKYVSAKKLTTNYLEELQGLVERLIHSSESYEISLAKEIRKNLNQK